MTTRSLISTLHAAKAFLRRHRIYGALEYPRKRSVVTEPLVVSGWAFSPRAPIVSVEAWLGGHSLGRVAYRIGRPDVARVFAQPNAEAPGYQARFEIPPQLAGRQLLSVRITDEFDNVLIERRWIRIASLSDALGSPGKRRHLEVESARWVGASLTVDGWALSPDEGPLSIVVRRAGETLGTVRVSLSRPDVAAKFPDEPAAMKSGFRFRATLAEPDPTPNASGNASPSSKLLIELRGRHRQIRSRTISVDHADGGSLAQVLESVITLHAGSDRLPTVLDWDARLESTPDDRAIVFSPLCRGDVLPYADQSIDVVALPSAADCRVAEARRVATIAVLRVESRTVTTLWSKAIDSTPSPSVSIVVPAYGHAALTETCLSQLMRTLPSPFPGEVIVVDDASTDDTDAVLERWQRRDKRLKVLSNERNVGFLESCNRAALAATGDLLIFLNNDTLPQPGWLAPLVATLNAPGVGAVGAKLVYPDGRLQEAGGVIFSDGTGWNFGNRERAVDAPHFNAVRDVDYCSGAVLATPRALFLELGGFDRRFSPAYYEDTDYCFRLRERGLRVVFQPASVVVHAGGGTGGTDEESGAKRSQLVNRAVFRERWHTVLQSHRPAPPAFDRKAIYQHAVRDPRARRALVWAPTLPEHDRESGSRRVYDLICFLRDANWAVTFVADSATGGDRYISTLQQMGVVTFGGRDTSWAGAHFLSDPTELVSQGAFDLALLHFWWIAERHLPTVRHFSPSTTVLVDSVDLHFLRRARSRYRSRACGENVVDTESALELQRELNAYAAADAVLAVSEKEAAFINDFFADSNRTHVVGDAESLRESPLDVQQRRGLLFLGNFRHSPNVEALTYLLRDIVPRLPGAFLEQHPISVVGNDLDASLARQCAAARGVEPVGWVPAVEPYLERAFAMVVPLQHGAGTKRKVIQAAMAMTPCVSTSVGIEGLNLVDDRHVLVADDAETFAAQIVRLAGDRALWGRLACAARVAVDATHGRETARTQFLQVLDRLQRS